MRPEHAYDLLQSAVTVSAILLLPLLGVAIVVSLVVNLLQTMTQLQDQTIAFVPRLLATGLAVALLLPWSLGRLSEYAIEVYRSAGQL